MLCLIKGKTKMYSQNNQLEKGQGGDLEIRGGEGNWPCSRISWLRPSENLPILTLPLLRDNLSLASIFSVSLLLISGESCKNFNMALRPRSLNYWKWPWESLTIKTRLRRMKRPSVIPDRTGNRLKWWWSL